ncbi:MAG TPA: SdrD B-like domain-containing protein, partial [Aggregatilineales bacterium]|nr:SdrD B-like domain-containing protein [Aggregatilineales bacterium]
LIVLGQQLVVKSGSGGNDAQAATPSPGATGTAEATGEPVEEPTTAPTEEPAEVAEQPEAAATGSLCVLGYEDGNGNAAHDAGEANLAGITFVLISGDQTLSRYTTDGISEPYCFSDLLPGTYTVTWQGDMFTPTSEQTWQVQVAGGDTLSREFGAQPRGAGADGDASPAGAGMPNWAVALLGSLGTMLALSAIGAVGYFAYVRPRMP